MKFFTGNDTRSALDWTAEEWADHFRDAYRRVLSKRPDAEVTADDWYWAEEALDEYQGLKPEAKELLPAEKAALDGLLHRKR